MTKEQTQKKWNNQKLLLSTVILIGNFASEILFGKSYNIFILTFLLIIAYLMLKNPPDIDWGFFVIKYLSIQYSSHRTSHYSPE